MLTLSNDAFLAAGAIRRVYRHPENPRWCVKVLRPKTIHRDESAREVRESERLARGGCDFQHMPRFQQWVETNFGLGTVWDLVLNHDGTIAAPLLEALEHDRIADQTCRLELARFQQWCLRFGVLTRDIHPKNLVCRFLSREEVRLVLVDGGGNNEFIPVSAWFRIVRQQKVARHWQRFAKKFEQMMNDSEHEPSANWQLRRRAA